jgi:hypothetical protein
LEGKYQRVRTIQTIIFFLFISLNCLSEGALFTITGTVSDSITGKGVELANITIKQHGQEKILTGATANPEGKFLLEGIAPGKYDLSVTYIGYTAKTIFVELNENVSLGIIPLKSAAKSIDETVVIAQKSLITKTSEKTVFNVAQSPANQVGTAEDVLRNMPGVSIDQKGTVTISGKQGVKVLVDGKPNAFAQSDLQGFLKSVPASSIEAIELITNPSARYDAEGNAGIINIKLKKGKADGLNGTVSAGYGFFDRYNGNFALNYRKNKINVFANYSAWIATVPNRYIESRTISLNDTVSHYNMDSKGVDFHMNHNIKAGLDYFIDDKNTLTYTAGANYSPGHWLGNTGAVNENAAGEKTVSYNSTDDERSKNYSIANDIQYTRKFDTTEQRLDIDLNHTYVSGGNDALLNSVGYDTAGAYSAANSLQRHTNSVNGIHNMVFQLDYVHPLKKWAGNKIEAGVKNETTVNKNEFNAYKMAGGVEVPDTLLSNSFNYTENIAAAYGILSGGYKKWLSYSGGLRIEHTYIHSNNNSVNKNYVSFFPSASLGFNIGEIHSISASYSRRIQRPQFRQINNTISYIDQYSTWQGNSFLQPSFSHIVSLSYTAMVKQHMFSVEASSNFQTNGFIESSRVDSNRITRGGNINGADSKVFSLTFYSKLQFTKWWDMQMSHAYVYCYFGYKQGINTAPISGHSYRLWASTDFKFWKNAVIEIGGWFNSRGVQSQGTVYAIGGLHASIKKSFFKDRLTVSIAGQNLLNTVKWHWTVNNTNLSTDGTWSERNRTVMINISYRFGTNKNALERKERDGNDRLSDGGKR